MVRTYLFNSPTYPFLELLFDQLLRYFCLIHVTVPITWKDAPANQFPILGSDYTVRCEVTANPTPTVTWLRNGDIVSLSPVLSP